jgi:hypothetical protein
VEEEDGSLRTVSVEPGLAAGGLVEVTPIDGELEVGDWVVVGREGSTGSSDDADTTESEETEATEVAPDTTESSAER